MIDAAQTAPQVSSLSRTEERAILTVTCLAAFLFFNSFGSIGVALPAIQKQFGNSLSQVQWITLMGVVTVSSLSFCFGRAGGMFGQRRIYKIGVALYAVGAGLGAVSMSFVELLLARAVMAFGLAMALPMSTAILAASFEAKRRGRVLGLFASAIAVGRMTGPTIGGVLLEFGSWPWVFWMNFILGAAIAFSVVKIFAGPGERRSERFDVYGALALLVGYPALLLGLTFTANLGLLSALVITSFLVAFITLTGFVWIELRTDQPLIDVRIFKQKVLAAALAAVALSNVIHYPIALCAPLYLQNVLGSSAMAAGLMLAVLPLSTALASPLSGRLADQFDAGTVASTGLVLILIGIAGYSRLGANSSPTLVIVALSLIGSGIGIFTPANQKIAFASVKQEDYGVLAAMLSSFGTAAGTIGTTVAVALMEIDGKQLLWREPEVFANAQRFAFACLAPVGLIAFLVARKGRSEVQSAASP
jgi:EmrB/QacA subfamily drug resistance transporter